MEMSPQQSLEAETPWKMYGNSIRYRVMGALSLGFSSKFKCKTKLPLYQRQTTPAQDTQTHFLMLWPSSWPDDLNTQIWPRYSEDVPAYQKYVSGEDVLNFEPEQDTGTLFCFCDLDLDPMTSIHKFDLDILKMHLHTKNDLSRSELSTLRALQRDTQTYTTEKITTYMQLSTIQRQSVSINV